MRGTGNHETFHAATSINRFNVRGMPPLLLSF